MRKYYIAYSYTDNGQMHIASSTVSIDGKIRTERDIDALFIELKKYHGVQELKGLVILNWIELEC